MLPINVFRKTGKSIRGFSRLAFILAAALCLAVPLTGLAANTPVKATYRVPLASEPITLDPAKFSGIYAMTVANNLFDGLVEFDQNINVR
ncbi:MAG: hypothetical protein WBG37_04780, partial [Desulfobacterales bacterium]